MITLYTATWKSRGDISRYAPNSNRCPSDLQVTTLFFPVLLQVSSLRILLPYAPKSQKNPSFLVLLPFLIWLPTWGLRTCMERTESKILSRNHPGAYALVMVVVQEPTEKWMWNQPRAQASRGQLAALKRPCFHSTFPGQRNTFQSTPNFLVIVG